MVCPICLEKIDDTTQKIFTTECHHRFHKDCIESWMKTNSCPSCRKAIDETKPIVGCEYDPDIASDIEYARTLQNQEEKTMFNLMLFNWLFPPVSTCNVCGSEIQLPFREEDDIVLCSERCSNDFDRLYANCIMCHSYKLKSTMFNTAEDDDGYEFVCTDDTCFHDYQTIEETSPSTPRLNIVCNECLYSGDISEMVSEGPNHFCSETCRTRYRNNNIQLRI